jgi:AraC-like DNA-binding protein
LDWLIAEMLLRGAAAGALAATAIGFTRSGPNLSMRIAGLAFCISVIAYVLNSSPALRDVMGLAIAPITFFSLGGGGYFWLFVVVLFEDRRLAPVLWAPAAFLTALGFAGIVAAAHLRPGIWIAHNIVEMALAAHALFIIYNSWRGDLVEARRRLRGPFLAVVTFYTILLSGLEIGESLGFAAPWYSLAGGAALAALCLAGCYVFLEGRAALFGAVAPRGEPAAESARLDPADRVALDRLAELVDKGEAWRREGLTIAALAAEVGTPEHRLRRLINDRLGHRNFAAYVNARRIEAAKRILSDPAQARTTIAAIAFDLGFGSLGPFNRAFKEATGATPTEWRKQAFEAASPNPENSR